LAQAGWLKLVLDFLVCFPYSAAQSEVCETVIFFMDTKNLIALATEEDTIPCNEDRNIKQGLSKRSKLSALTVVVVLLVGLGLTSVAVQQKSPLQASTNNFIQENMDQDMLNAVNHERKQRGASALCYNSKLMNAAAVHSKDMARHSRMSHTGSDGSSASKRVTRAGYSWNRVAENVAMGQSSVSSVMRSWMNSAGHKRNILNSQYTMFGYAKSGRYWTQVFGASSSESCSQASSRRRRRRRRRRS